MFQFKQVDFNLYYMLLLKLFDCYNFNQVIPTYTVTILKENYIILILHGEHNYDGFEQN